MLSDLKVSIIKNDDDNVHVDDIDEHCDGGGYDEENDNDSNGDDETDDFIIKINNNNNNNNIILLLLIIIIIIMMIIRVFSARKDFYILPNYKAVDISMHVLDENMSVTIFFNNISPLYSTFVRLCGATDCPITLHIFLFSFIMQEEWHGIIKGCLLTFIILSSKVTGYLFLIPGMNN